MNEYEELLDEMEEAVKERPSEWNRLLNEKIVSIPVPKRAEFMLYISNKFSHVSEIKEAVLLIYVFRCTFIRNRPANRKQR